MNISMNERRHCSKGNEFYVGKERVHIENQASKLVVLKERKIFLCSSTLSFQSPQNLMQLAFLIYALTGLTVWEGVRRHQVTTLRQADDHGRPGPGRFPHQGLAHQFYSPFLAIATQSLWISCRVYHSHC